MLIYFVDDRLLHGQFWYNAKDMIKILNTEIDQNLPVRIARIKANDRSALQGCARSVIRWARASPGGVRVGHRARKAWS